MILAIKTDQPRAELYLLNGDGSILASHCWEADRELANTINQQIEQFLGSNSITPSDLKALLVFTGAGSFTGLRIGTTVANALAYGLGIPITAGSGGDWMKQALNELKQAKKGDFVSPSYEREPNITLVGKKKNKN